MLNAENEIVADGSEAIYIQIARLLKTKLSTGELLDGDRLPSYRALAGEFGVSVGVIQRAMKVLRNDSLVRIHHGKHGKAIPGKKFVPEMAKFGLIHPYSPNTGFERALFSLISKAFEANERDAITIVRSSQGSPEKERELAETMVYNGIKGLLLSPQNNLHNVEYFQKLSERIPVVLIDQAIGEFDLPSVIFDYHCAGREIGVALRERDCRKSILLLNENVNQSLKELRSGIEEHIATESIELPLFQAERLAEGGNFTLFDDNTRKIRELIDSGRFDALFCPFDMQFDRIFMMEEAFDSIRSKVTPVTLRGSLPEWHSRRYCKNEMLEWEIPHGRLFSTAVERLCKWCDNRRKPVGIKKIKLKRMR